MHPSDMEIVQESSGIVKIRRANVKLVVSLAVFSGLAVLLAFWERDHGAADPDLFRIPAGVSVEEVHLVSADRSVILKVGATSTAWTIGDSISVDPQRVQVLVAMLERIRPGRSANAGERDSLKRISRSAGVQVEFRSAGIRVASWYVCGNGSETWFLLPDDSEIRRVSIPGYRSDILSAFSPVADFWRTRRVFDFNWRNFTRFTAEFSQQADRGFTIERKEDVFGLRELTETDTSSVNTFLDAVSLLEAERLESSRPSEVQWIRSQRPWLTWTISEVSGTSHRLYITPNGQMLLEPQPGRFFTVVFSGRSRRLFEAVRQDFILQEKARD